MPYLVGMSFFHLTSAIRHKTLTVLEVHSLLTKGGWGTKIDIVCAGVTQLVESLPSKQVVASSSLVSRSTLQNSQI